MKKDIITEKTRKKRREAFDRLRIKLGIAYTNIKVILFTSSVSREGTTSTVIDLANSYAAEGKKVLILDTDLRNSMLSRLCPKQLEKSHYAGLSHYLLGEAELTEVVIATSKDNLDVVVAGDMSSDPVGLMGNGRLDALLAFGREHYDLVLIDSPPLGVYMDAMVIVPKCDGVILVVASDRCSYQVILETKLQLEDIGGNILGVVLNKVQMKIKRY